MERNQKEIMSKVINLNEAGDNVTYQKEDDDHTKKISNTNNENEFQDVSNQKNQKKSKITIAAGKISDEQRKTGFSGGEKSVWLYINRVSRHVTGSIIGEYLKNKTENSRHFIVEELVSRENSLK